MTTRRPLVQVSGGIGELPAADVLTPGPPSAFNLLPGRFQHSMYFFAVGTGTPSTGTACFVPHAVGPAPNDYDAFAVGLSTVQSGGSATLRLALYPDDGSRCVPDLSGGPIRTATLTTFTALNDPWVNLFSGGPVTLDPGMYWAMALYTEATTPTTKPVFRCFSNTGLSLPLPAGTTIVAQARALSLAGQTGFPSVQPASSSFSIITNTTAPEVMLRGA